MMSIFKKKPTLSTDTSQVYVDIHSHLLPGIDDGSKSLSESITLIAEFQKLGYKKLIVTPHIMSHRYQNTSEIILEKLAVLREALEKHGINIIVEAASEYYLDEHFLSLLRKKDLLTFNHDHVLFEISYTQAPQDLEGIIFEMILAGYTPVLAHPERYLHMHDHFERYEALKEQGVLFQLNINSLAGYYSKNIKQIAEKLVAKGMVDFLGSDVHKMRHFETFKTMLSSPVYHQIFEKNRILNNTLL